ncbi:MAG: response regulator [Lachnospiraceae bacterium]|nr:response regulator [Lachnospiraceae bacterium]
MRAILIDDIPAHLEILEQELNQVSEVQVVGRFTDARKALEFAGDHPVELAFLDINMPEINGIILGRELQKIMPEIALIYVTGYKEYAYDAFQLNASAYILKPFHHGDILNAIERARRFAGYPAKRQIYIRTFGRFEIFLDGKPVSFKSKRAKELMALLVKYNGSIVTTEIMLTELWEEHQNTDANRSLCRKTMQRLRENLEEAGISDIMLVYKHGRSIDKSKVECDFFQYLEGKEPGISSFHGEFMSDYSWAETTLGYLMEKAAIRK